MENNLCHGNIWKGSNAQISVVVLPPFCTATTTDMSVDFYTTPSAATVQFTQSGGTLSVSGNMGTVVFQPVQLETLDDGQLKYVVRYTSSGTSHTADLETRWFLKTPNPYNPIDFVTSENVGEIVDEQLDERLPQHIGEYAKVTAVTQAITSATQDMATKTWVNNKGYLTQHQQLKTINNQSLIGSGNINISGGTAVEYTGGTNIDITNHIISVTGLTIPTKTSQLTNDSGFLTQHQDISMKADTTAVTEAITSATQDMATKTWVGNQGFVTSQTSTTIWTGTLAEYNAIATKSPTTIYLVK